MDDKRSQSGKINSVDVLELHSIDPKKDTALVCVNDFKKYTKESLDQYTWQYFEDGSLDQTTHRDNEAAFRRFRIIPRYLRDVGSVDITTTIQGHRVSFPVGTSPSAFHKWVHQDGEIATARAVEAVGAFMILSDAASISLEEVAKQAPKAVLFLQTYLYADRSVTLSLIRRAEAANFKGIVVTIDSPVTAYPCRRFFNRNGGFHFPEGKDIGYKNFGVSSEQDHVSRFSVNPSASWADITWMKQITRLPVIVKGVLTSAGAKEAVQSGVDGILVSNHGGRVLDGVPATIDVLEDVLRAVQGQTEVYLDGGVRNGVDVLRVLALGARAVLIGRPVIWGLTVGGQDGVQRLLTILREEFRHVLAYAGAKNTEELSSDMVRKFPSNL